MTTPRIEEMVELAISLATKRTNRFFDKGARMRNQDYLDVKKAIVQALTEAHQAGYADGYKQGKFDAEVTAEYGKPKALQDKKYTQIDHLKDAGLHGSTKDPDWNPVTKRHDCCGSPRSYYHRRNCPLCKDI